MNLVHHQVIQKEWRAMSFRLSKENRNYFRGISKEFKIKLDMYYLCLMMGIASNNKAENPEAGELIDYWADKYKDYSNYILSLHR